MIGITATNLTSPLGFTTEENYRAVKIGQSALKTYGQWNAIPERICAALFSTEQNAALSKPGFTRFESLAIHSVEEALSHTDTDCSSNRLIFILSTTKANIEELAAESENDGNYASPGDTALRIAAHFGFINKPVVVCNACISGISAMILAQRLISYGLYDTAVVCGADCQTEFTVSGFLSFKSLSPEECRPFDIERLGLNLGEAAATVVMRKMTEDDGKGLWRLAGYGLTNDAYHISAPSPLGEGIRKAALKALSGTGTSSLSMVSAHGTATMFNDQMESKALEEAGLTDIPVSAIKGCFGHTLGASGIFESVLSMRALNEGAILPTRGFSEMGVSGKIRIADKLLNTEKTDFLKTISGFGGCNGAVVFSKSFSKAENMKERPVTTAHSVSISPDSVVLDGVKLETEGTGREMLTGLFKKYVGDYPKFYKMDLLSRLVFMASELLLRCEAKEAGNHGPTGERAVIIFNRNSSIVADRRHLGTISRDGGFFPSPAVFVHTLPNVSTGEVAIRNHYMGETTLYILDSKDDRLIENIESATFRDSGPGSMICGWADCSSEDIFEAQMEIKYC